MPERRPTTHEPSLTISNKAHTVNFAVEHWLAILTNVLKFVQSRIGGLFLKRKLFRPQQYRRQMAPQSSLDGSFQAHFREIPPELLVHSIMDAKRVRETSKAIAFPTSKNLDDPRQTAQNIPVVTNTGKLHVLLC